MANPFGKMQEYFSSPNRNTHDWSFQNNLTLKMGKLTPCCYIPLTPGESVRIDPTFGFNFEPMVFPVQTRMRAHLHFFYVRYKDLYKDWLDKFGMTKEGLELPYMKLTDDNRDMVNTGELGDYLNIPTVTYGEFGSFKEDWLSTAYYDFSNGDFDNGYHGFLDGVPVGGSNFFENNYLKVANNANRPNQRLVYIVKLPDNFNSDEEWSLSITNAGVSVTIPDSDIFALDENGVYNYPFLHKNEYIINPDNVYLRKSDLPNANAWKNAKYFAIALNIINYTANGQNSNVTFTVTLKYGYNATSALENRDVNLSDLPFCSNENPEGERLVNFPFRAYEFVYNSFYRDERNNPYKINGQVEYNKYLPSTEGGADTYHYKLRNANWEQDFLTTATQSPQFGVAPLVGVTSTGTMSFADEEGNTYTAQARVGDDGDSITGISVHSPDMPVGTLRALIDTVSSGISISDFRNVNALQRLLEKRMRHGLKYVDMVQASFGTRPKNLEISMPEFIGGVNHDVIVNAVSQTIDTENVPLGTKGGTASVIGGSNHDISCYADDFGCIIGIVYVAPVPNYSQLLPKHYFASEALDYFHPEFGHIGYQPIFNKEVAPLQFFRDDKANDTDNYNSVFGYQRPWYDMISKTDEVHGNFRNNKRRYLVNRVFDTPPALTEDFLLVDSDQVNDVFAVTEDTDKIFGQVYFRIKRKNAVPTLAIPRLES